MDIQPLISSAVVAAVVSGIVSFLSTRATLKASRNKDRFDRLFPILRTIKTKLHEIQVKQIELGHVIRQSSRSITEQQKAVKTILEMQRLHDETVLLYVSEKAVFDKDLRNLLTTEYEELLSAARQRTLYPSSLEELTRFGAELEKKDQFFTAFSQATDEQLIRLRDI